MAKSFPALNEQHSRFIAEQHVFFVGTATADSRVNVSPKGMDTLRVLSPERVIWLNLTGSGNESAAHVQLDSRMTLMFCAFSGNALILRVYGRARVVHPYDTDWRELSGHFAPHPGARQVFDLTVDLVQSSCGHAVPLMSFECDRGQLSTWAAAKGGDGIRQYWHERNQQSIDGIPTHIVNRKP